NQDDNCPTRRNTAQKDRDLDGTADACDLCPNDPAPTLDTDFDGIGDKCDSDDDNDSCLDSQDQHPKSGLEVQQPVQHPGCSPSPSYEYGFEGDDTDGDGVKNCIDVDDDNDGICDVGGPYKNKKLGTPLKGCAAHPTGADPCPLVSGESCVTVGKPCREE